MNLKINNLINKLNKEWITDSNLSDYNVDIYGIKLYNPLKSQNKDNFIYVVDLNENPLQMTDQLPLNLFLIKNSTLDLRKNELLKNKNWIILHTEVTTTEILNKTADIIADYFELIERPASLFNKIIKGRGLPYIIDIASELLENPILLGDANHRLLAASKFEYIDDESWLEFRNTGFSSYEYTQKYGFKKWIQACVQENKPVIGDLGKEFKYRRIFSVVKIDDVVVAHLAVLEYNRSFTAKDIEVTAFICDVLASEMTSNHYGNVNGLMASRLLLDLLQGINLSNQEIANRIKNLKIKLPERMQLVSIRFNNYSDSFPLISFLREGKKEISPLTDIVIYEDHLVFLIKETLNGIKKDHYKKLQDILDKNQMSCGISQIFSNIKQVSKYFRQSTRAIDIARKKGQSNTIIYYENYAIIDLIREIDNNMELSDYCHSAVIRLKDYDKIHNTEYLNSLYTYIINAGNIVSSAEALFIHRNTMSYRMGKIQEIVNIDLTDQDQLMSLFFSYKILEYIM